jgi:hypothetical protein
VYVSTWRKRKNVKTMISTRWRWKRQENIREENNFGNKKIPKCLVLFSVEMKLMYPGRAFAKNLRMSCTSISGVSECEELYDCTMSTMPSIVCSVEKEVKEQQQKIHLNWWQWV